MDPFEDPPSAGTSGRDGGEESEVAVQPTADHGGKASTDTLELFRRYRETGTRRLRNELVERHLHLAEPHVRRFAGKGIADDDLRQAALLGMLGAVERFDPELGFSFSTFASRTIDGELKRQLRDRSWLVRPPRQHQEVFLAVRKAQDELEQRLRRSPTVDEIATAINASSEAVLEAIEAGGARRADSLDAPDRNEVVQPSSRAGSEGDFGLVDIRLLVGQLLEGLDERERTVIQLRFFDNLGQPKIAEQLGLSQSYVSRLIRRVLSSMRHELEQGEGPVGEPGHDDGAAE